MAKLTAAILLAFIIEVSLFLFGGIQEASGLFEAMMQPSLLSISIFFGIFVLLLSSGAFASVTVGLFTNYNYQGLFSAASASLIVFGMSLVHLWVWLSSQMASIFDPVASAAGSCTATSLCNGWIFAALITAPLLIFYIIAITEWSRAN
jgi:hypothetical protein